MDLQLFADEEPKQEPKQTEPIGADQVNGQTGNGEGTNVNQGGREKTFTQTELDAIITDRLKREKEKYKDYETLKKDSEELRKIQESQMTEAQRMQAKIDDYTKTMAAKDNELAALKAESTKQKVLSSMGLPLTWTNRIFGTTEEEIKADAEQLKKMIGAQGKPIGGGMNPPGGGGTPTFTKEQISKMAPEEINSNWEAISKLMAEGKLK